MPETYTAGFVKAPDVAGPFGRAYSILNIKRIDEDQRVIEGIATTPSPDRMDDIVESMGATFTLPMPLLWQHRSGEPVGHVEFAQATEKGIPFRARLAKITEPGELKNLIDKAWQAVKHQLVRGVSIGFRSLESEPIFKGKNEFVGIRFKKWEWLELSLVTIPANQDASIHTIRSIDAAVLAASGNGQGSIEERVSPAGVTAKPNPVVKAKEAKTKMPKKSLAETISAFEATRAAKAAAREEIMDKANDANETLDAVQTEEYDGLAAEIKSIDEHLKRLHDLEAENKQRAAPVKGEDSAQATQSRQTNGHGNVVAINGHAHAPVRVSVRGKEVEPWRHFIRYTKAKLWSRLDNIPVTEIVMNNERWMGETPEVLDMVKAPVPVGTSTDTVWAGPLVNYQIFTSAFAEYLRALTIIGRIPGLTRVPFKIRVPRQTTASTVNWVGEGAPKPLSSLAFDSITLDFAKIAGIVVITEELVRASDPSAEEIIRRDLTQSIVAFMDSQFVDPSKAATGISPASITNGVTPLVPTGTTAAAFMSDINRLFGQFLTNNLSLESAVLITTQQVAMRIGTLLNSFGQAMFPNVNAQGGSILGVPVVVSENIPSSTGSPVEGWPIILVSAREILLADDGQVTVDASREASLQMETAPDSPPTASTLFQSLWQTNSVGIRAERFINWVKRRSTAVSYLQSAVYTG